MVILTTGLAAATLALTAWLWRSIEPAAPPSYEVVATVERVSGNVDVTTGQSIRAGDLIATADDSRLGLRVADGTSIRVDTASRVRLMSGRAIELIAGAVYIDDARETQNLEVRTRYGTVRDIGTQFEVRLLPDTLRVRVRSGLVMFRSSAQELTVQPATELSVGVGHVISTRDMSASGPEWVWTTGLAPAVAIEGRALATVLVELCREHGWSLRYGDARAPTEASRAVLHGTIQGLTAADAVKVIFAASGSRLLYRLQGGVLLVTLSTGG
jgi:ferric-dicitrate binding protein FerR (iron transport regulator)